MDITFYPSSLTNFFNLPPDVIIQELMIQYGWLIFAIMFVAAAKVLWLIYVQTKWARKNKFVFLAIDVPRGNEQSPRAVENMLSYLAGAHGSINFFEKWFEGKFQLSFSYEIVSIDGYTQFIIRTPVDFRNLVESSIYSQYPDAEIVEVDDYTEGIPTKFPNDEYDIQGAEFIQAKSASFPIKLYTEFEHQITKDDPVFKDPMASLMDLCSSLRKGEQLWFQLILIPTDFKWTEACEKDVDKILGKKPKVTMANKMIDGFLEILGEISEIFYSIWGDVKVEKKEEKAKSMMELRPKEKRQIEAIHQKVSKLGYLVKVRVIYVGRKEVFNGKVFSSFVGFIKQFAALDLNNLKPDTDVTMTKTAFFARIKRLQHKKANLIHNYIARDGWAGRNPGLMNVEELATLWHFPIENIVKAPLLQKTPGKKAKPPMSLPTDEVVYTPDTLEPLYESQPAKSSVRPEPEPEPEKIPDMIPEPEKKPGEAPSNLPF